MSARGGNWKVLMRNWCSVGITTVHTTWPYLFHFPYKSYCLFCRETVPKAEGEADVRPPEVAQPAVSQHGSTAEMGKE